MAQRESHVTASDNIIGNVYDKYGTRNPIARYLMQGFLDSVTRLYSETSSSTVLEVGCGEGSLVSYLLENGPRPDHIEACDLNLTKLTDNLDPFIQFREASIYELPYPENSFDLVVCCEVLEHLEEPAKGMSELARVAKNYVIVSTPREPMWRLFNMARGKYLKQFGNTPGHIQHFSRSGLIHLAREQIAMEKILSPIPWTILLGTPHGDANLAN